MIDTCYYDGRCGLCTRSRRVLEALDFRGVLRFVDQHALDSDRLPVDAHTADVGMPMQTADRRVLVGFPAVRRALRRTVVGAPVAGLMYVPGISHICAAAYRVIARNRRSCRL
jgi:predicted DCC family thiol-disulfide oxidoreductase YuxK